MPIRVEERRKPEAIHTTKTVEDVLRVVQGWQDEAKRELEDRVRARRRAGL